MYMLKAVVLACWRKRKPARSDEKRTKKTFSHLLTKLLTPVDDVTLAGLSVAAERLGGSIAYGTKHGADAAVTEAAARLKRRLLIEIAMLRALEDSKKLTTSYIKYMEELIQSCVAEAGNAKLIAQSEHFLKCLIAERGMSMKFEEARDLCK